jgi:hypothetical protein
VIKANHAQGDTPMSKAKPIHEIRLGAVKAAIWENETTNGKRHNVTVSRIYKDGDEWKHTESFGRDDLPLLAKVADFAHTWIFENARSGQATQNRPATAGSR